MCARVLNQDFLKIFRVFTTVKGDFDILVYDILSCSNNSLGVLKDCSNQVSGHQPPRTRRITTSKANN